MTYVDMQIELERCKMIYHGVRFEALVEMERLRLCGETEEIKAATKKWTEKCRIAKEALVAAKRNFLDPIEGAV